MKRLILLLWLPLAVQGQFVTDDVTVNTTFTMNGLSALQTPVRLFKSPYTDTYITNNGGNVYFGSPSGPVIVGASLFVTAGGYGPCLFNALNVVNITNTGNYVGGIDTSNLTSGTLPDARFPAILPAASGANLTSLPAGQLTGTIADARLSGNVPLLNTNNVFTKTNTAAGLTITTPGKEAAEVMVGYKQGVGLVTNAIPSGGGGGTAGPTNVFSSGSVVTITNTTSETTLISFTVPANTITATGRLRVSLFGDMYQNNTSLYTVRIKFGGTTLYDSDVFWTEANSVTRWIWSDTIDLVNLNSTSSQAIWDTGTIVNHGSVTTGQGTWANAPTKHHSGYGISSVDTTSAQTFTVTIQPTSALNDWRLIHVDAFIYN